MRRKGGRMTPSTRGRWSRRNRNSCSSCRLWRKRKRASHSTHPKRDQGSPGIPRSLSPKRQRTTTGCRNGAMSILSTCIFCLKLRIKISCWRIEKYKRSRLLGFRGLSRLMRGKRLGRLIMLSRRKRLGARRKRKSLR